MEYKVFLFNGDMFTWSEYKKLKRFETYLFRRNIWDFYKFIYKFLKLLKMKIKNS